MYTLRSSSGKVHSPIAKHLINALVERDPRKLSRVGVIRLASHGFTRKVPPFVEFPADLRNGRNQQ